MTKLNLNQNSAYPHLNEIADTLVSSVQQLSLARSVDEITAIVRKSARILAHADGATFIFRDNNLCFYADEDAIGPLWKGKRFPLASCISGWAMMNKQKVIIADIYQDARIPIDLYRPTFVRSLAITPIRTVDPIAAIGSYWSKVGTPSPVELDALQALADATSIALENIGILDEMKQRVRELEETNHQLNRLTWLVSHDLKEPIRGIQINLEVLEEDHGKEMSAQARHHLDRVKASTNVMKNLVVDLLDVSRVENYQKNSRECRIESILEEVKILLDTSIRESNAKIVAQDLPNVYADPVLLSRVFQNLISNAIKFSQKSLAPVIEISAAEHNGKWAFCVKDNGVGVDQKYKEMIFEYFTRLQNKFEYPGSGIGLAVCKKIIQNDGGEIWVESEPSKGSRFYFTVNKVVDELNAKPNNRG